MATTQSSSRVVESDLLEGKRIFHDATQNVSNSFLEDKDSVHCACARESPIYIIAGGNLGMSSGQGSVKDLLSTRRRSTTIFRVKLLISKWTPKPRVGYCCVFVGVDIST
ncbi:4750_t:CDS:2 [Paraglomus occultum]|uniref:4750_t:CDS:1 n=1 Tax=Paraglomus occultum TaxID=144539 RepID=A0A9N9F446_9GLOM|nr:4750_t:CDS:2 [Paraglomus occultum]